MGKPFPIKTKVINGFYRLAQGFAERFKTPPAMCNKITSDKIYVYSYDSAEVYMAVYCGREWNHLLYSLIFINSFSLNWRKANLAVSVSKCFFLNYYYV